jgi:hypothetical protein
LPGSRIGQQQCAAEAGGVTSRGVV